MSDAIDKHCERLIQNALKNAARDQRTGTGPNDSAGEDALASTRTAIKTAVFRSKRRDK
jgi:hypothetical protein